MNRARVLSLIGIAFLILILGIGAGVWWYLFGPNKIDSAELVPGNTVFFASIPNAANIAAGYQTSQLKQLVDSPNSQPISDSIVKTIGEKNIDLLNTFLPNLSGQSFFAVTHFDPNHPEQIGIIAAMKPKAGTASFDAFIAKLNLSYQGFLRQGSTGAGNVAGVDYQWLRGPGGSDKLCVAKVGGWIVTTWGEASLQDWIERYHKKSATPSLAQNPDYQKSLASLGKDSMTILYVDYHSVLSIVQQQLAKINPNQSEYFAKKLDSIGSMAMGSRFENGEIVDHFSCMMPKQAQLDGGFGAVACPFETLKFTGPNTQLYWATSVNCQQYWKNLQEQATLTPPNPMISGIVQALDVWAKSAGIDLQHNLIDPLGAELSVQLEWNDDTTYPELGFLLKVDKPDDFKPTITALIEDVRKIYATSAVINELTSNGQVFAALKFVQTAPITPTITETGPYFGFFTSENLAVRSFARDEASQLTHNPNFSRQIGDKRTGAGQIAYVDSPHLVDRAYRTAMPYISLLSMLNKDVAAFLQGKTLPNDLTWLAPMGTWSYVETPNDQSVEGYSVSGIGNQGILLAMTGVAGFSMAQTMGMIPKMPVPTTAAPSPAVAPITPPPAPVQMPTPTGTITPPSAIPAPVTNSATSATASPPDASSVSPQTNSVSTPATNSPAATPDASKPQ